MSVVSLGKDPPKINNNEVRQLATNAGISIPEDHVSDFATLLGAVDQAMQEVLEEEDYVPKPDLAKYPRFDIHEPSGDNENGWATRCITRCLQPKSDLLKGKTIALKDNIALAGVKCTNGTTAIDWTPEVDAVVATRIMDAGGIITGKATCENMCMEGISDTSCTGNVSNPFADGYSAGGSSSGCGRLVADGVVDMAIGCDQGGSIRIPSANCGIVGLKPTWGLVPYTGIISFEATIDHAGPMARSVRDAARLLEAIAGPDGIDDRQSRFLPAGTTEYTSQLEAWLGSRDASRPLAGFKIGLLEEGWSSPNMDPNIKKLCEEAVDRMQSLGAEIISVSIPAHARAAIVATCYLIRAGGRQGILQDMTGRKQLYMLERVAQAQNPLSQVTFDAFGPAAQNGYLRYLFADHKYGPKLHAKCANLLRKINVSTKVML